MKNNNLGIGVMLKMLFGDEETGKALNESLGKKIDEIYLDEDKNKLVFRFTDQTLLYVWDGGQSCCEHRYMCTDDNLKEYAGSTLLDFEIKNAPDQEDEYGVHEVQFLDVKTDKGVFQMSNHNEHNGYYGGFWIQASK